MVLPRKANMAKQAKKTIEATAEETIIANAEAKVSNFAGSLEEAMDEAITAGVRDGNGKAALLDAGRIALVHGKSLRGTDDKAFAANCLALRLKYVEGFNSVAQIKNPLEMIPTEGEKAEKLNKVQASKLGVFVKAGCMFPTGDEASAYLDRVIAALAKTDFTNAKTRESTFERVAKVLRKADAGAKDETETTILEKCAPVLKEEKKEEAKVEEAKPEAIPTVTDALVKVASDLSHIPAVYGITGSNAAKLNGMVAELTAMAKMLHAADKAEAKSEQAA
jgi:hypothetical protein